MLDQYCTKLFPLFYFQFNYEFDQKVSAVNSPSEGKSERRIGAVWLMLLFPIEIKPLLHLQHLWTTLNAEPETVVMTT